MLLLLFGGILMCALSGAENKPVPSTPLPDVLHMADGTSITNAAQWPRRAAELQSLLTQQMYGQAPPRPEKMRFQLVEESKNALGGIATRKQISILLTGNEQGWKLNLLLYIPNTAKGPAPAIVGLNFWGNHAISSDPGILLSTQPIESGKNPWIDLSCVKDHHATEACRGINSRQWPLKTILNRGYAVATVYRGDIDPDTPDGYSESLKAMYPELQDRPDNFSTIGAWAWSLSRIMDYLETDPQINHDRVAVFGWSRLGKAALWAGATDKRFAMVISNESGAGGAKLFHRGQGENIRRLNTLFPHWFCNNFRQYNDRDTSLPFDQHMVLALIAPRPLYVASAQDDHLSDPEGEFLAAVAADPVYRLLGTAGLPVKQWPPVNTPIAGQIGYHMRTGGHDVTGYDWAQYLDFADKYL